MVEALRLTEPMTPGERAAFVMLLGSGLTTEGRDRERAALAIRLGASMGDKAGAMRVVIEKRQAWREWLATTQRRWQRETRRPSRARHHDSIAIRERYVRCA
jgi:hypothetical protein